MPKIIYIMPNGMAATTALAEGLQTQDIDGVDDTGLLKLTSDEYPDHHTVTGLCGSPSVGNWDGHNALLRHCVKVEIADSVSVDVIDEASEHDWNEWSEEAQNAARKAEVVSLAAARVQTTLKNWCSDFYDDVVRAATETLIVGKAQDIIDTSDRIIANYRKTHRVRLPDGIEPHEVIIHSGEKIEEKANG